MSFLYGRAIGLLFFPVRVFFRFLKCIPIVFEQFFSLFLGLFESLVDHFVGVWFVMIMLTGMMFLAHGDSSFLLECSRLTASPSHIFPVPIVGSAEKDFQIMDVIRRPSDRPSPL